MNLLKDCEKCRRELNLARHLIHAHKEPSQLEVREESGNLQIRSHAHSIVITEEGARWLHEQLGRILGLDVYEEAAKPMETLTRYDDPDYGIGKDVG